MSFSDIDFILKFLPIFMITYLIVPNKLKNWVIAIGSVVFYCIGGLQYFPALAICFVLNFFFCKYFIGNRKFVCALSIILNVAIMVSFRFLGFQVPGLSFVLMEMMALSIDVCKGNTSVNNFKEFATYFFFFPKLLSGPITVYTNLKGQITDRIANMQALEEGLGIFILGLSFKVLLADEIIGIWRAINQIGVESISVGLAWLGLLAISLNIYFDFQGYSLMAIGAGKMLGFTLPENFDSPYLSKSISEFYRRWHMTLGAWFKNYLYIPMGGSRVKLPHALLNIFIVWVVTGLWHGFKVHYIAWGLFLGAFVILEKLFLGKMCAKFKVLPHIYVLVVIPFSWMLFFIDGMNNAYIYVLRLFAPLTDKMNLIAEGVTYNQDAVKHLGMYAPFLIIGVLLCLPRVEGFIRKQLNKWWGKLIAIGLFAFDIYMLYINSSNPFAYFQF